jgi:hypothetical protein
MTDADDPVPPSPTERIIHSLGNHLALIETRAAQCRRQPAQFALLPRRGTEE